MFFFGFSGKLRFELVPNIIIFSHLKNLPMVQTESNLSLTIAEPNLQFQSCLVQFTWLFWLEPKYVHPLDIFWLILIIYDCLDIYCGWHWLFMTVYIYVNVDIDYLCLSIYIYMSTPLDLVIERFWFSNRKEYYFNSYLLLNK